MAERLENLDNILREWAKEKISKSLDDALNRGISANIPNLENCARCKKDLKDNIDNSRHLARKYARIFVLGHDLFSRSSQVFSSFALGKLFASRNK